MTVVLPTGTVTSPTWEGALATRWLSTGRGVDTQGDAFFRAFAPARSAVACAAEIRDALASGQIRVRMGVHTGEALVVERHYVGMDVHRAARIGADGVATGRADDLRSALDVAHPFGYA